MQKCKKRKITEYFKQTDGNLRKKKDTHLWNCCGWYQDKVNLDTRSTTCRVVMMASWRPPSNIPLNGCPSRPEEHPSIFYFDVFSRDIFLSFFFLPLFTLSFSFFHLSLSLSLCLSLRKISSFCLVHLVPLFFSYVLPLIFLGGSLIVTVGRTRYKIESTIFRNK